MVYGEDPGRQLLEQLDSSELDLVGSSVVLAVEHLMEREDGLDHSLER